MADISKFQTKSDGPVYNFKYGYGRDRLASIPSFNKTYAHNAIPRGKNIQEYFDNGSLYTKISNGTFEDLYIGDYWKATYYIAGRGTYYPTSITFRIAGFDTFFNCGNTNRLTKHHAVIVPDQSLGSFYMNQTDTTKGGYLNSYMNKTVIGDVATSAGKSNVNQNLYNIFGTHLLTTDEIVSSSVDETIANVNLLGAPNGHQWTSCQAILMSEVEIFGSNVLSPSFRDVGITFALPLFNLMPNMRATVGQIWLRNVVSKEFFSIYSNSGDLGFVQPTNGSIALRPRFIID